MTVSIGFIFVDLNGNANVIVGECSVHSWPERPSFPRRTVEFQNLVVLSKYADNGGIGGIL
jgi:hypothetical protein